MISSFQEGKGWILGHLSTHFLRKGHFLNPYYGPRLRAGWEGLFFGLVVWSNGLRGVMFGWRSVDFHGFLSPWKFTLREQEAPMQPVQEIERVDVIWLSLNNFLTERIPDGLILFLPSPYPHDHLTFLALESFPSQWGSRRGGRGAGIIILVSGWTSVWPSRPQKPVRSPYTWPIPSSSPSPSGNSAPPSGRALLSSNRPCYFSPSRLFSRHTPTPSFPPLHPVQVLPHFQGTLPVLSLSWRFPWAPTLC